MSRLTVFGHTGFIGSNIGKYAQDEGRELILPKRGEIPKIKLGDVIYAIGVTSGFAQFPSETVNAHVCFLKEILEKGDFDNLLYISSARVYYSSTESHVDESTSVKVNVFEPSEIYIISKLMGESLCLTFPKKNIKIVRLSSVFGEGMSKKNLLGDVLYQAITSNNVIINQPRDSGRDYISIDDVIPSLFYIMKSKKYNLYNITSGRNVLHCEIANVLEKYGINVEFTNLLGKVLPPIFSNERLCREYTSPKNNVIDYIEKVLENNARR
jgi:nucleoside-diphosphate-sugar epimerase